MPDGTIEEIERDLEIAKTLWVKAYRNKEWEQEKISKKAVKDLKKKLEQTRKRIQKQANAEAYMKRRRFEKLMYLKAKT